MMKVLWLSQYNVYKLLPEIKLKREVTIHNSSWIHALSEELSFSKEIKLYIITYSHLVTHSQTVKKNGIVFFILKYSFPFTNKGFPWYLPIDKLTGYYTFRRAAAKIIEQVQPDILHVHGTEGGYFLPARKSNIPILVSIQGIISEYVKLQPNISEYFQTVYEKYTIKKGKNFGCRTRFDSDFVKKINKDARIFDLPEAINSVFFERTWNPEPRLSIIFVGTVTMRKGIEDIIHSLTLLKHDFPTIKLKIIGSGDKKYVEFLKKNIKAKGLSSNVLWFGSKSPEEIASELSKSTIFVLPTLGDNSPNSLAEAMAVGIPSVATNVGGIPSMVNDKFDGLLFEKHNVIALAKMIKSLLVDRNLQRKLSLNSRKKVYERNYPSTVSKKYLETYKLLINELPKNFNRNAIV